MTKDFPYLLLADDDPDDRSFFCAGMERVYPQVRIRTFRNGDELLEYLNQCPPMELPGCIVLDYKMPPLTALQLLQATGPGTRYAEIPKVVWSTSNRKKDMDECLSLGALRYVIKPVTESHLDVLIQSLESWIIKPAIDGAGDS